MQEPRERWRPSRSNLGGRSARGAGAVDGQGDTGRGLRCPARRGGGDDTEEDGVERACGARGRAVDARVLAGAS